VVTGGFVVAGGVISDDARYDVAQIGDACWDENIVTGHGTASSAGLLLRVLGGAISTRANNATLNALLGVADVAATDLADTIWDEDIVAAHGTASTAGLLVRVLGAAISTRSNNATLNAVLGVPDVDGATAGVCRTGGTADAGSDASNIVDAAVLTQADTDYWVGNFVMPTTGNAAGQVRLISAFTPGTDTITVATPFTAAVAAGDEYVILQSGSGDVTLTAATIAAIVDGVWDEDIVAAHGTADTAGLLLRALGAVISQRTNNATLNALLGVPDAASNTIAYTILDEVVSGAAHTVADSVAQRLYAIDILVEVGGTGDLTETHDQAQKIDKAACDTPATADSLADKMDDALALLAVLDRQIILSVNRENTALRVEVALEQYGIIQTGTYTQCTVQILDEASGIVRTISPVEFGAINARGYWTYSWDPHTLTNGTTYQLLCTLTDGAALSLQTTKVIKVITTAS
jgi:hypothetical protein